MSHLGDITEHQDQFERRVAARRRQPDGAGINGVPYGMSPGNHDQNTAASRTSTTSIFPPSRFLGQPVVRRLSRARKPGDPINRLNKDNYELFSAGGLDFLIIHIEIDWPSYAVTWADKIIKRYPNRRVILSTHAVPEHVERASDLDAVRPRRRHVGRSGLAAADQAELQRVHGDQRPLPG